MPDLINAMKALSDETRLRILSVLMQRECCVCEVMQALDISQTRASRNLSILHDAGFLKSRKEGLWAYYSLDEDMNDYLAQLVQTVGKAVADDKRIALDRERLKKAKRLGPGCAGRICAEQAGGSFPRVAG